MGKSLAALFGAGRSSAKQISKLNTLLSLAIARLSLFKNQHQARCSLAHSDIAQLLHLSHYDRALLHAEIVVKEENMLDVFAMIQSYCHLITERSLLLQRQKDCPHELKEAISSLVYASSRSGEMPELQHVCNLFSDMFGREFVRAATELRNSCGVNPKIVQKLSTRQPSLESRVRIVKEIAAKQGVALDLNREDSGIEKIMQVDPDAVKMKNQSQPVADSGLDFSSGRSAHGYKDATSAAQAACDKAEDAAAAARAAVELSRSSQSSDDRDNKRDDDDRKKIDGLKEDDTNLYNGKVYPVQYCSSASEEEEGEAVLYSDKQRETNDDDKFVKGPEQLQSGFYSDSTDANLQEKLNKFGSRASMKKSKMNAQFENKTESETENDGLSEKQGDTYFIPLYQKKYPARKFTRESFKSSAQPDSDTTGLLDSTDDDNLAKSYYSETISPQTETVCIDYTKKPHIQQSKVTRRAVSVRTRQGMQK